LIENQAHGLRECSRRAKGGGRVPIVRQDASRPAAVTQSRIGGKCSAAVGFSGLASASLLLPPLAPALLALAGLLGLFHLGLGR